MHYRVHGTINGRTLTWDVETLKQANALAAKKTAEGFANVRVTTESAKE